MASTARPDVAGDPAGLDACQDRIDYQFRDKSLLRAALTHASGADHPLASNERMEFLGDAIENGGTSLDDLAYLLPDGRAGENLDRLRVYGRTDMPCPNCGTPIQRIVIRGRSSHFCPNCQPERP